MSDVIYKFPELRGQMIEKADPNDPEITRQNRLALHMKERRRAERLKKKGASYSPKTPEERKYQQEYFRDM